ncbi:MAG: hypothetical protein NC094_02735 [Bacteroidales bacterium]|nr:hypothetical protein [Lachnoclostridium sp.]MCM1383466.1 hypothetical protein [Lachnoclostridium sp.]MCM1464315.1 hypothetical protein [Bacteroidales bacterium]
MRKQWKRRINNKIKASAAVLFVLCFAFAGCGFISPSSRIHKAEEALKEKYGCEVKVLSSWTSGGTLYVTCAPENDRTMVFEAQLADDCSRIYSDIYLESIISYQISQQLEEDLQELFPECYIHTTRGYLSRQSNYLSFEQASDATPEMFAERYPRDSYCANIHVIQDDLQDDNIETEYQYFSEILQDKVKAGMFPDVSIHITYVDSGKMQQCKQYFKTNYEERGEYKDIVSGCYDFRLAYVSGKITDTYEEYEELRRGGN